MKHFLVILIVSLLSACAGDRATLQRGEDSEGMSSLPTELVVRGLPAELSTLEREGRIAEAEAWLDKRLTGKESPGDSMVIERERLRRLRRDFSVSPAEMLAALRKAIPDATADDLDRWRTAGQIQHLTIDGQVRYFRREPRNLFRLNEEARTRRDAAEKAAAASVPEGDPNTKKTAQFDLHTYVEKALAEADSTGTETPLRVKIRSTHTIIVHPGVVPKGKTVRCWIPFPQEYGRQREVQLLSTQPAVHVLADNGTGQRTVYLEAPAPAAWEPLIFKLEYVYTTSAYVPKIDPAKVSAVDKASSIYEEYTADRPPHIDLNPELRALAKEIVGEEQNPYLAAGKIFRWMDANFRYCSEMEYSLFTGITDKAMNQRAGDCGIHALMFIALCRASGIPARWQSGWAMRPGSENMHDWAEFYVEPYGWLPADPSFGLRKHDNPRVHEFYIGHLDPFRMIANLDYESGFTPAKTHWRSDNIDNQRGEVEWSGGNLYYDQWDYKMEAEYAFE